MRKTYFLDDYGPRVEVSLDAVKFEHACTRCGRKEPGTVQTLERRSDYWIATSHGWPEGWESVLGAKLCVPCAEAVEAFIRAGVP